MSEEQKNEIQEGMANREEKQLRERVEQLKNELRKSQEREDVTRKINDELRHELLGERCEKKKVLRERDEAKEKEAAITQLMIRWHKAATRRKAMGLWMIMVFLAATVALAVLAGVEQVPVWTAFLPAVCAVSVGAVTGWTE